MKSDEEIRTPMEMLVAVQQATREIGEEFKDPDDDWQPAFFVYSPCEEHVAHVTPVFPTENPMASDRLKDLWAGAMNGAIKQTGATAACMVSSAFMVITSEEERAAYREKAEELGVGAHTLNPEDVGQPMPRDNPRRMEVVIVNLHMVDRSIFTVAEIERDGKSPPKLGPYKNVEELLSVEGEDAMKAGEALVGGRFGEAISDGLTEVATRDAPQV